MKIIIPLVLIVLALNNSASATSTKMPSQFIPKQEVFDDVRSQAMKLGYRGYDIMACLDGDNKVIIGGLLFRITPLQILLVEQDGSIIRTERISTERVRSLEKSLTVHKFKMNGQEVNLTYGMMQTADNYRGVILKYDADYSIGSNEPQKITCFLRKSGLE